MLKIEKNLNAIKTELAMIIRCKRLTDATTRRKVFGIGTNRGWACRRWFTHLLFWVSDGSVRNAIPAGCLFKCALLSGMALAFLASVRAQDNSSADDYYSLLRRGFSLHQQGNYAGALPLLEKAWKVEPHDYFANLLVGIDLLRTDRAADSISYLQEAAHQRPKEDFPYEYLGEAQAHLRHYSEAAVAYERALAVAPASPQAIEGAVGFWLERFRELAAQLRATTKGLAAAHRLQARSHAPNDPAREQPLAHSATLDPDAPGIWSELALANLRAGNVVNAGANIARAFERNPVDQRGLEARAILAAMHGNWSEAVHALNTIGVVSPGMLACAAADWPEELQPPATAAMSRRVAAFFYYTHNPGQTCNSAEPLSVEPFMRTARSAPVTELFREQRWEAVIAAPEPNPGDLGGWYRRGVAFAELERCANAIPPLERTASGRMEQDIYTKFLLSWCYAQEAARVTRDLQQHDAEGAALVHMVRGDVLLRMQANSSGAVAEYNAALSAHPNDPEILERLAEAQYESGQLAEATANARLSLSIDPYRFSAMETLAGVAMEQRDYEGAIPYLQKIVAHDPREASAQVELGTVLAQTGSPADAVQHLLPALAAGYPDEKGSLHATLGAALRKIGRNAEATEAFAQARALSQAYQSNAHRGGDEK
jgi:tetratricopeptide (TPR) repeat protein